MPISLKTGNLIDEDKFFKFCQINDGLEFERNCDGDIILLPFRTTNIGLLTAKIGAELAAWNKISDSGIIFGSSTGFTLSNKSVRSPDISWIINENWEALNNHQREVFAPICPNFIIEILSLAEETNYLHNKMTEYIQCGAQLGWLIDYINSSVYIYSQDKEVVFINSLKSNYQETLYSPDLYLIWNQLLIKIWT